MLGMYQADEVRSRTFAAKRDVTFVFGLAADILSLKGGLEHHSRGVSVPSPQDMRFSRRHCQTKPAVGPSQLAHSKSIYFSIASFCDDCMAP